jgi:ATP-dependent Clp protease ATP-binding subunit ClpC
MFDRFTKKAIDVVIFAQDEARRLRLDHVGTGQILLGLLNGDRGIGSHVLNSMGVEFKNSRKEVEEIVGRGTGSPSDELPFTARAKKILELSLKQSEDIGHNYIGTEHLLLAILEEQDGVAIEILKKVPVDLKEAKRRIMHCLAEDPSKNVTAEPHRKAVTLTSFGNDLTAQAAGGSMDPIIGRSEEVQRVIQILGRRSKNNPVLLGEAGVGKTAVAEALAQRIVSGEVSSKLQDKAVVALDLGLVIAGTKYRGEFEARLSCVMDEVKRASGRVILFVDEVHTLVGAGATEGAMDAANLLKPAMARGELQCMGATTLDEYRKYICNDAALERRFQPVRVGEPSLEETIGILQGIRGKYEEHHKITYTDEALEAAGRLADKYISDRYLPDKAVDLMDEAGSRVRIRFSKLPPEVKELGKQLQNYSKLKNKAIDNQEYTKAAELNEQEGEIRTKIDALASSHLELSEGEESLNTTKVTEHDIACVVSAWTRIPLEKMTTDEAQKLLKMEDVLHARLIGQDEAVMAVSRALRRARAGLKNPTRPIGAFLFAGPTGVGKTELAKIVSEYFFGSQESMIRLDMSEFMERHTVSKLVGSPPGYIGFDDGGRLTEAVRRAPYSLVLFDEIEKAHPDVYNLMLQIFDDGRLTDSKGRVVDFKNTLIVLTSNAGAEVIAKPPEEICNEFLFTGSGTLSLYNRLKFLVHRELRAVFRPEFINRLDEIVVFRSLGVTDLKDIAHLMIEDCARRVALKGIHLHATAGFKEHLVKKGNNLSYGARPLRRAVTRLMEDLISENILLGVIKTGDWIIIHAEKSPAKKKDLKEMLELQLKGSFKEDDDGNDDDDDDNLVSLHKGGPFEGGARF